MSVVLQKQNRELPDFRTSYLSESQIAEWTGHFCAAYPEIFEVRELGRSGQGRSISLFVVGRGPEKDTRPAVWIDAGMHASELCGTSVVLNVVQAFLRLHAGESLGLPEHVATQLRATTLYAVPCLSPDGAEAVLASGVYKRSVARDERQRGEPHWSLHDVDGDGLVRFMRKVDPTGELVAHPEAPEVLVPRNWDDTGPFYKLFPEGTIENYEGSVPNPHYLSDNYPDLNRNFPYRWRGEHEQAGAGAFPGSEPEARAVIAFAHAHPNIFVWLNLHTFGGCFIRPAGDRPDEKMKHQDLCMYREVGAWAESLTGYPMVSGFHEFLYEPTTPLYGALSEWAYEERGALASVCEIWDLFAQLGMPRAKRFVDVYTSMTRDDVLRFYQWDREHNEGRVFQGWKRVQHPQLGEVEVGGIDRRVGLFNPPLSRVGDIADKLTAWFLRVASLVPMPQLTVEHEASAGNDTHTLVVRFANTGYLPTYGMQQTQAHAWNAPPVLSLATDSEALRILGPTRQTLEHLEGWGRGTGAFTAFAPETKGGVSCIEKRIFVQGQGKLEVAVTAPRIGRWSVMTKV